MRSAGRGGSSGPADLVRTLTKFGPVPKVVRVLTTFGPLRRPLRHLPLWHGHLHQFCPSQKASKPVQPGVKSDHIRARKSKKRSKRSKFRLTHLNTKGPNRPWWASNGDPDAKKRVLACFGNGRFDVSVMGYAACDGVRDGRSGRTAFSFRGRNRMPAERRLLDRYGRAARHVGSANSVRREVP